MLTRDKNRNNLLMKLAGSTWGASVNTLRSFRRPQRNGLPEGSVLAPIIFNLFSNDLPVTHGQKFLYADDICLATQGQYFSELECSLY